MKQFIVLMAILPIMLLFMMQYTLEQRNSDRIAKLQSCVYAAKEQARQEGCFTAEIVRGLKAEVAERFHISGEEVVVEATDVPRYRVNHFDERELIHYKVAVPIDRIMAGHRFLGIKDEANRGWYVIEGSTASERLIN